MRSRSRKQAAILAFGRYVRRRHIDLRKGHAITSPEMQAAQQRIMDAQDKGCRICWRCDIEYKDSAEKCPDCGADPVPF